MAKTSSILMEDALSNALLRARKDLWDAPPRWLPVFFSPWREFVLDPCLVISRLLLPLLTRNYLPRLSYWSAYFVEHVCQPVIKFFFRYPHETYQRGGATGEMRETARSSLLSDPTAPGTNRVITIDPPSQLESAFLGILSFLVSVIGDIFGALTNPKKYQGWMDACTQLQSYLVSTGVSKELHQAIVQPLLQGRLLANVKILSDIQKSHLCTSRAKAAILDSDYGNAGTNHNFSLKDELSQGHKWMRFATAAYGTEMIRSALDRETDSEQILHELESAMAFHCQISEEDILLLYTNTDPDIHTLHHFLAVDHKVKSIVLALRGTLSLSGAIVDVKGMAIDYCSGQAHQGMAEMADNIWNESGDAILNIIKDEKYKGYTFVVTGHSLGAGTACLLNLKLHVEELLESSWPIRCYAFAPPPTFLVNPNVSDDQQHHSPKIEEAIKNTVAYIHDNDVVPHLSVSAVRRLAFLFDAVDQQSAKLRFWQRWRIFYEYDEIPDNFTRGVVMKAAEGMGPTRAVQGACELIIPARVVVWCDQNELGKFEAIACDPKKVAQGHVYLSQDMLTDHLPEQYENALDALVKTAIC